MHTYAETTFVRVYGARTALLGVVGFTFVTLGMIRSFALLFTLATVLPLLDAVAIVSRIGLGHELVARRHPARPRWFGLLLHPPARQREA